MHEGGLSPEIAIVVPVRNECAHIATVMAEIETVLGGFRDAEVIAVDDGSVDGTADELERLAASRPWLRLVRHAAGYGKSAALLTGVRAARAPIVVTIDGDGRNDPTAIPRMVAELAEAGPGCGLVAAQRLGRRDSAMRRFRSKVANSIRAALLDDGTRDATCGLKCFPREIFLALPQFDGLHRFLPALIRRGGYAISLIDMIDRPGLGERRRDGLFTGIFRGFADLIGVNWLVHRRGPAPVVVASPDQTGERATGPRVPAQVV